MRKTKGITLISLIITIIVMLILVAVTVTTVINSGLIEKTKEAAEKTKTQYQEESTLGGKIQIGGEYYASVGDYVEGKPPLCKYDGKEHTWENGTCTKCGKICIHSYENEVCTICGFEEGVYAVLYSDGDLCFNTTGRLNSAKMEAGNTVILQSENIKKIKFNSSYSQPWESNLTRIETVTIEEKITPKYTNAWFKGCSNLTEINNISNLNTKEVIDMCAMFYKCSALETLDVTNFNTEKVTLMEEMFYGCSKLTALDLKNWDVKNVTSMYGMFRECRNLQSIELGEFNAKKVVYTLAMFMNCTSLENVDTSNFSTSSALKNMGYMFYQCSNMENIDLSKFCTENVDLAHYMFYNCKKLTNVDLSSFNTANVLTTEYMFAGCGKIENLNLSNFNTANITSMKGMFADCYGLTLLDIRQATFEKVTDYDDMFTGINSNLKIIVNDSENGTNAQKTWIQDKLNGKGTVYTVTEWQENGE